ncbi:hypothetical protein BEWA_046550 [Theileria equi strain WA]|uniref:Uncharacterized protein n=1 Tax=Theileria equi strain WA TaxID=1537102 RepID=L1L9L6_THEEQ|nr:hypothetical protein BEWA_046550 [Theileria equi strain WA]EKX72191.1 hypothetical protein BEWA_046550 [Theileria equi strain WA]|eukprot:XP_004831643.1 hypothetical protein BEWA_046550 [Theileria equi strain WA]
MTEEDKADVKQRVPRSARPKKAPFLFPLAISKDVNDSDVTCVEKKKGYHVGYYFVSLTKKTDPFLGKTRAYGYKCYRHSKPTDLDVSNYYFFYAWYKGYLQSGIKINQKSFKSLSAYYFSHDTNNTTPLFIRVNPKGEGYYERTSAGNVWRNVSQVDDSELYSKFMEIVKNTKVYPVVINVTERNEYYIDGYREDEYLARSKVPRITVTNSQDSLYKGYEMNTHKIISSDERSEENQLKDMRVISTIYGGHAYEFKSSVSDKRYSCVSVYYWDLIPDKVLLLQLGYGNTFYCPKGGEWTSLTGISKENLTTYLDSINCIQNSAHFLDIGETSDYICWSCATHIIYVEQECFEGNWTRCTHKMRGKFSANKFWYKYMLQSGLPATKNVSEVHVYFSNGKPLMVDIDSDNPRNDLFELHKENEWIRSNRGYSGRIKSIPDILKEIWTNYRCNSGFIETKTEESSIGGQESIRTSDSESITKIAVGGVSGSIITILGGLETFAFFKYPNKSVIRLITSMFNK